MGPKWRSSGVLRLVAWHSTRELECALTVSCTIYGFPRLIAQQVEIEQSSPRLNHFCRAASLPLFAGRRPQSATRFSMRWVARLPPTACSTPAGSCFSRPAPPYAAWGSC